MAERLNVGDKVIYPAHGAAVIESIERKVLSGNEHTVYVLRILRNGMRILVPLANIESIGVRRPISPKEIGQVYEELRKNEAPSTGPGEPWNRRYRKYKDTIHTGSIFEIARVLRLLHCRRRTGTLSLGEKRLVDAAMDLLVGEVSCAKEMREEIVRREIEVLLQET